MWTKPPLHQIKTSGKKYDTSLCKDSKLLSNVAEWSFVLTDECDFQRFSDKAFLICTHDGGPIVVI